MQGLSFTEHFDTHPTEWDACVYNDAKIDGEITALRDEYGQKIFIGKGIEVCYQPSRMDFILEFLASHRFDIVLLSIHWASDRPIHVRDYFEHLTPEQFITRYLEAVRDATAHVVALKQKAHQPFHVLGHLDFVKRYAKRFFGFDEPIEAPDLIDEILRNCLDAGLIPEINTSTLRNDMSAPMPGPEVVTRYAALGGTEMSVGSDSHSPQYIGSHFEAARQMLLDAGIRHQAVFKDGQRSTQRIDCSERLSP